MTTFLSHSTQETEAFAANFAKGLTPPKTICLSGDLGAGKTAFTRGLAKGLGSTDMVSSPTFTIMHQYDGKYPLYHFDLYRIQEEDELYDIGFEEFLAEGIAVIEWPDRFRALLPEDAIQITLTYGTDENERIIEVET